MYRRSKFLEILLEIRQEMARESDYDVDLFAEMARSGRRLDGKKKCLLPDAAVEPEKHPAGTPGAVRPIS